MEKETGGALLKEMGGEWMRKTERHRETGGGGGAAVGRGAMTARSAAAACAEDVCWCCLRAPELPKERWDGWQLKCPLAVLWLVRAAQDLKVFLQGTQFKDVGCCCILVAVVVGEREVLFFIFIFFFALRSPNFCPRDSVSRHSTRGTRTSLATYVLYLTNDN